SSPPVCGRLHPHGWRYPNVCPVKTITASGFWFAGQPSKGARRPPGTSLGLAEGGSIPEIGSIGVGGRGSEAAGARPAVQQTDRRKANIAARLSRPKKRRAVRPRAGKEVLGTVMADRPPERRAESLPLIEFRSAKCPTGVPGRSL